MSGKDWLIDWWKVLALVLFGIAMMGAYWIVHGLAKIFPSVFMWFGGIVLLAIPIVFIWGRFVRRPVPPERTIERE